MKYEDKRFKQNCSISTLNPPDVSLRDDFLKNKLIRVSNSSSCSSGFIISLNDTQIFMRTTVILMKTESMTCRKLNEMQVE